MADVSRVLGAAVTLDEVYDEYREARGRTARKAKFAEHEAPHETCRYCGRFWKQWAGSKLDGHAKCMVDERFRFILRALQVNPQFTYQKIADRLGITISVVRCWATRV